MRTSICLGLAAAALVTTGAPAADSIRPGYWSTTNILSKPIERTKTENRCITPAEIAKFTSCYINHHYKCTCPEQSNSGGRIVFHGDCVDSKGTHVLINGEGTYTAKTLQMSAQGQFTWMGLKGNFATHTDSHWLADTCPAGAPGSDGR